MQLSMICFKTFTLPTVILLFLALSFPSHSQSKSAEIYFLNNSHINNQTKSAGENLFKDRYVSFSTPTIIPLSLQRNSKTLSGLKGDFKSDSIDMDYIPWEAKRHF